MASEYQLFAVSIVTKSDRMTGCATALQVIDKVQEDAYRRDGKRTESTQRFLFLLSLSC